VNHTTRHTGRFKRIQLPRIRVNDRATIRLIGETSDLTGHVESIAGGIEDRERSAGSNLLANVNPTFSWVRLAQRIPVRIVLDPLPDGVSLISGRTATDRRNLRCAPVAARLAAAMAAARPVARRRPWWPATPERRRQVKRCFPPTITAWSGFHHPCQKCARQRPRYSGFRSSNSTNMSAGPIGKRRPH